MRPARSRHAQRRSETAPVALLLAVWVLALAPVVHPLLAHGAPFLRQAADEGWVHHRASSPSPANPAVPGEHRHAPGAPEHLKLALLAAALVLVFRTVVLAFRSPPLAPALAVALPRRWSTEQPQAP